MSDAKGSGLASLPVHLIRGKRSPLAEKDVIESESVSLMDKTHAIQSKYALTGRKMSDRDRSELDDLTRRQRWGIVGWG